MTALFACLALVVLVLAAVALGLHILRLLDEQRFVDRWARRHGSPQGCDPDDRRHGWCEICGLELRGAQLHEVIDAGVDDDGVLSAQELMGGGTAMVAEFCAEHCPGTCRSPHRPGEPRDPFRAGSRG